MHFVRELDSSIGRAVAERTVLRKYGDKLENWGDVANRVSVGNASLIYEIAKGYELEPKFVYEHYESEQDLLAKYISKGALLTSGRHLQHGDENQGSRHKEVFVNCAVSVTSFMLFYLLMSGCGVGRSYDDDVVVVNWDYAPNIRCVLDASHPDYDYKIHETVAEAKHKYRSNDILWHTVEDSREGWGKAFEVYEFAAFEKIHKDKLLILDFSKVRAKGTPIGGMQNRPASGPAPLMEAILRVATIKGAGLKPWLQAMYVDHYLAECVLVGGARRSSRAAIKYWKEEGIFDFISIKRGGFLWTSNNSIGVDKEFWNLIYEVEDKTNALSIQAHRVFNEATAAAYNDKTGEPGFINIDKLVTKRDGIKEYVDGNYVGSKKYQINDSTLVLLSKIARRVSKKVYINFPNPCVTDDTWILTSKGPKQVKELIGIPFEAIVNGKVYDCKNGFFATGNREIFELTTTRGYKLKVTGNHKIKTLKDNKYVWVEAKDLVIKQDEIVLNNHRNFEWEGAGGFNEGWLVGEVVGDGGHNPDKYRSYLRFWGPNAIEMSEKTVAFIRNLGLQIREDFTGGSFNNSNKSISVGCKALTTLCSRYIEPETKKALITLEQTSSAFHEGFLRGLFDSDGTVIGDQIKGVSVRLIQVSLERLELAQRMLARLGIASTIYKERKLEGFTLLPDGLGGEKLYPTQTCHELVISKDNLKEFNDRVGFYDPDKSFKLESLLALYKRPLYKDSFTTKLEQVKITGYQDVYDCTIEEVHEFDANGIAIHNCFEISLFMLGDFCTVGDICPYFCDTDEEFIDASKAMARFLIRVNSMDSVYKRETERTNRIGVSMIGLHEWFWKRWNFSWHDVVDEEKSKEAWLFLAKVSRETKKEAARYSLSIGRNVPHTDMTIKPGGTTSKFFSVTEGIHLPAMLEYVRWVQFINEDPLVKSYIEKGYPWKELKNYKGTTIIGFPTQPEICKIGMGDKLVTASQATPEEQYKFLMLIEKYWLRGIDEDGNALPDTGNQASYTMKFDQDKVSINEFRNIIKQYQPLVKCCSMMPNLKDNQSAYEYLPETAVSRLEFEEIVKKIERTNEADVIDLETLACSAGGVCPVI